MIPGSNLLQKALTVIAKQSVLYYQATGRAVNNVGQDVTTYAIPVTYQGSWQAIPRNMYKQYGLDLQKSYYTFYVPENVIDVQRDLSGDQIVFNNKRYQCESNNDWYSVDGWKGVLCVEVDDSSTLQTQTVFGFSATDTLSNNNKNFGNGGFYDAG